jgi:hypothetical protein
MLGVMCGVGWSNVYHAEAGGVCCEDGDRVRG